jgi:hypothetical protein
VREALRGMRYLRTGSFLRTAAACALLLAGSGVAAAASAAAPCSSGTAPGAPKDITLEALPEDVSHKKRGLEKPWASKSLADCQCSLAVASGRDTRWHEGAELRARPHVAARHPTLAPCCSPSTRQAPPPAPGGPQAAARRRPRGRRRSCCSAGRARGAPRVSGATPCRLSIHSSQAPPWQPGPWRLQAPLTRAPRSPSRPAQALQAPRSSSRCEARRAVGQGFVFKQTLTPETPSPKPWQSAGGASCWAPLGARRAAAHGRGMPRAAPCTERVTPSTANRRSAAGPRPTTRPPRASARIAIARRRCLRTAPAAAKAAAAVWGRLGLRAIPAATASSLRPLGPLRQSARSSCPAGTKRPADHPRRRPSLNLRCGRV